MSLKMRLSRGGSKKRPYYRIVVADVRSPRDGRFIERIGSYNPLLPKDHAERMTFDEERVRYWLGVGAKPTDRVHRFLDAAGILARQQRENPNKAKPGAKATERLEAKRQEEEDRKAAAASAAEQPAEAPEEEPAEAAEEEPAEASASDGTESEPEAAAS